VYVLVFELVQRRAVCDVFYTAFRRLTPHHSTGAKFVAQSKVNRLTSQTITRTGMGARRISVRARKGSAGMSS